jgi:hypothetical protein
MNKDGIWTQCSLLLRIFGCNYPTLYRIKLIAARFTNLTSLSLRCARYVSLFPFRRLKYLRKLSLHCSHFECMSGLLMSVGDQLRCLELSDVIDIDLAFIGRICSSLRCLHIMFSYPFRSEMQSYSNIQDLAEKVPLPKFPSFHYLHLRMANVVLMEYVMSRYINVRCLNIEDYSRSQT